MARLVFLIGLPGSGKSTFAKQLLKRCPDRLLISTDAIRAQLFGAEQIQGPWLQVWQEVGRQFCVAVQEINALRATSAIYDATNVVRKQRRAAIALAQECGFSHLTGVWFNVPLSVCLERNGLRDRQVPEPVIYRMHRRLVGAPPSVLDGFDVIVEMSASFQFMGVGSEIAPY